VSKNIILSGAKQTSLLSFERFGVCRVGPRGQSYYVTLVLQADKTSWGDLDASMANGDIDSDDEDAMAERAEQVKARLHETRPRKCRTASCDKIGSY
jgi:hypothetical protein